MSDRARRDWPKQSVHFCRRRDCMIMVSTAEIYKTTFARMAHHQLGANETLDYYETLVWALNDDGSFDTILGYAGRCYSEDAALRQWKRTIHRARRNVWTPEKRRALQKQHRQRVQFERRQKATA